MLAGDELLGDALADFRLGRVVALHQLDGDTRRQVLLVLVKESSMPFSISSPGWARKPEKLLMRPILTVCAPAGAAKASAAAIAADRRVCFLRMSVPGMIPVGISPQARRGRKPGVKRVRQGRYLSGVTSISWRGVGVVICSSAAAGGGAALVGAAAGRGAPVACPAPVLSPRCGHKRRRGAHWTCCAHDR